MAKETQLSAEQLKSFLEFTNNKKMTASKISYRFGVYVDGVINTSNENPSIFDQQPDENGQIFYSLKKEDKTDTP